MHIKIPTLLLDEKKCRLNIQIMNEKASRNQVIFRPHYKTHQSAEIGEWYKDLGVTSITVSSVQMASYFANVGWKDILIAFPVNILEIDSINSLSQKIQLHLLVESVESTKFLIDNLNSKTGIYLKIDTGYHRTGLLTEDKKNIKKIVYLIKESSNLELTGVLAHAGHSYDVKNTDEIKYIQSQSIQQLQNVKKLVSDYFPECIISVGDTPGCSVVDDFIGVDEIRPGNFVFYDIMQYSLGICSLNQIAIALACPVVAKHKSRNELTIYGGAIHLSKEALRNKENKKIYGLVVKLNDKGWGGPLTNVYVSSLSQEHGIIKTTNKIFDQVMVGDIVGILPTHSCLTANLMNSFLTLDNRKITKFRFNS